MAPKPPRFTKGKGHEKLNAALDARVREVVGDGYVCANRTGDTVTIRLSIDRLLARIPKVGGSTTLVKVTGDGSGGGKYTGVIWTTPAALSLTESGDLTEAEVGQTGEEVFIVSTSEVGESTHALTEGTPKTKIFLAHEMTGVVADPSGKRVFAIVGFDWQDCA
jgi:hypothetical protein